MGNNPIQSTATGEIQVGATPDDDLRYWRAKEAVRHGELRLNTQTATRQAFESRATSLLGWIVAISSAVAAVLASSTPIASQKLAALVIIGVEFAAALACVGVVWPQFWGQPGYDPRLILDDDHATELEQLEALALGYSNALRGNDRYLDRAGLLMRTAFCLVAAGPVIGAIILVIASA